MQAVKSDQAFTLHTGAILAISAGLMDAYSFLCRGKVFANAQTGNILLCSVHLANGELGEALSYLLPIAAFVLGIALASILHRRFPGSVWVRPVLLLEALGLGCTAFLPQSCNPIANATISFVCGIQLESFQRTAGCAAATTMCVGNLRLAVHFAMEYLYARRREDLRKMLVYLLIILAFIAGAVAGDQLIRLFGERAIWGSSAALMLCVFLWKAEA